MQQRTDRMTVWGFILSLFLIAGIFLASPVQRFSELENRYLQGLPVFTWDRLLSHKYTDEIELFLSDQFPLRRQWVWVKSAAEQLRLQQENNGIYKGWDGYLFEKFEQPDYARVGRYVDAVNKFAANHPGMDIAFMLAPTSIGMYPERLPWMAEAYPQSQVNRYIAERLAAQTDFLDGFDFLGPHADEQIYYKTDHHWTTRGAYYAYVAYAERMGWTPLPEEAFEIAAVSDSFLGSYHTKSQFSGSRPDVIEVYKPHDSVQTEMFVADDGSRLQGLYDDSYLQKKDQYAYFLGGVHALLTLTSELAPGEADQEKLLVIKDSYAHNMLPFLTQHVAEIHVIDIRYYNRSIGEYMEEHGIDDVLLLFNTGTFVDNQAIARLK